MIRLGAHTDIPNFQGATALYRVLNVLGHYHRFNLARDPEASHTKVLAAMCHRIALVATVLMEHHANVNVCLDGFSILNFACMAPH